MKSLKSIYKSLEEGHTPKQFAKSLEVIDIISTVSVEEQMRIEQNFSRSCELLQAEECQSLSAMENIIASGPVMQKKLKK